MGVLADVFDQGLEAACLAERFVEMPRQVCPLPVERPHVPGSDVSDPRTEPLNQFSGAPQPGRTSWITME